ncbi:hypothetical protein Q2589_004586 [Salmonella enterica]|nr:hypothetical protein [Salmonella enterica]ELM5566272.1 hypothetical protein [Salmonella enterica]
MRLSVLLFSNNFNASTIHSPPPGLNTGNPLPSGVRNSKAPTAANSSGLLVFGHKKNRQQAVINSGYSSRKVAIQASISSVIFSFIKNLLKMK